MHDLLIRGGTVITAADTFIADVAVASGKIRAIGALDGPADRLIDARGMVVFAGAVDPGRPLSLESASAAAVSAKAAALGGTTTLFANFDLTSCADTSAARDALAKCAAARFLVDYGVHMTISGLSNLFCESWSSLARSGLASIHVRCSRLRLAPKLFTRALRATRDSGAFVTFGPDASIRNPLLTAASTLKGLNGGMRGHLAHFTRRELDLIAELESERAPQARVLSLWNAVQHGRLDENKFVDILSQSPAKCFGLFPRKGSLNPGSDADIVVLDPNKRQSLGRRGFAKGAIVHVFQRGRPLVAEERWVAGALGEGKWLRLSCRDLS